MLAAYDWPHHDCLQITLRSAITVCPHNDCIIAFLGLLRPSVLSLSSLDCIRARVTRRQCASTIDIAMLSLRRAAARLPANDVAISAVAVLALRPSVFPFFGPLTSRVTRCAACPKYIAIALFSLCWPHRITTAASKFLFALCNAVHSDRYHFSACLPPASRGATACPITLNLAVALLSIDDWTQRDCPYAVQPSYALNCCPLYSLCGMLAIRAAVLACMPPTTARLSTYMLQSCCHSNLVNLGALAKRTVIQPAFHRWLSVRMLYSRLCDRPTRQAVCSTARCWQHAPARYSEAALSICYSMPLTYTALEVYCFGSLLHWQPTALFGSTALAVRQLIDIADGDAWRVTQWQYGPLRYGSLRSILKLQ
eukprot:scaffold13248_cov97-Phaeocystis_antarctica.AAC.1